MFDYIVPFCLVQEIDQRATTPRLAASIGAAQDKPPKLIPDFEPVGLDATVVMAYQSAAYADTHDTVAFQDIAFFAAISSMRLRLISDALTEAETASISKEQLFNSAGLLAGLCQSVGETLEYLRRAADLRLSQVGRTDSTRSAPPHQQAMGATDAPIRSIMQEDQTDTVLQ